MATEAAKKTKSARHASAVKRARQTIKRTARNTSTKNQVKTFEKKVLAAIKSGKSDDAKEALKAFMSTVDRAAQKGVVHVKRAARRVGRLSKQVAAVASK
ncbi:MAG: 30S ribosomal protein S20 [Bdellovibrionota bacterium]